MANIDIRWTENHLENVLKKAVDDLSAERGSLMVKDMVTEEFYIKVAYSAKPEDKLKKEVIKNTRIKIGESIAGLVALTQKPLLINDMKDLKKQYPDINVQTDPTRYRSSLVVPIIDDGETIAIVNINNKIGGGKFIKENLDLAIMLAEYCGAALHLEQKHKELSLVNEVVREMNKTNDLASIYQMIVSHGVEILGCKGVSIMIVEKDKKNNMYLEVKESTDKSIIGQKRQLGEGVSGWVWKTGEPILIKTSKEGKTDRRFEIINKPGSFIVAPLNLRYQTPYALNVALTSKSTIGVLNFTHRIDGKAFTEAQLETIISYANLVAIAIEKAKFYGEIKTAYLSTVEALAAAIEAKDKYTRGHVENVVKYSLLIADELKLLDLEREDLHFAALLHDVGKIGIEEDILNKPGKLTPEQYEKIKRHIEEGENILKHTSFMDNARKMVRHHHERYDGKGYPDGLKGEEIPLCSRILAITDAYDVMMSDRVYRKSLGKKLALIELEKCAGSQFDENLVRVFLKLLTKEN